jgi:RHS repeat-associated protein
MVDSVRSGGWVRRFAFVSLVIAIAVAACGDSRSGNESVGAVTGALSTDQQRVLGFESVSDWTTTSGSLASSNRHVEGAHSLAISNGGNSEIDSRALSSLGPVASAITLDVLLPTIQPNPSWMGTLKLVIECPSQGLFFESLAEYQLQGQPTDQFVRFQFPLSSSTRSKLSTGTYSDLKLKIFLNVASGAGPWLLDRLTVSDASASGAGGANSVGGGGGAANGGVAGAATSGAGGSAQAGSSSTSNDATLGFESASLWAPSAGTLSLSDTHVEGLHSLQVAGITYAEITSAPLSRPSNISSVLGFDLSVPNPSGDIWWWGTAAISIDCPSLGIFNRWLGQQQIDGSTLDRFRRVEVALPDDVKATLGSQPYNDLRVKIILTVPANSGPYLLDRLTFAAQVPEPAPAAPSAAVDLALGMETLSAWHLSAGTLNLSSVASERASSIAVSGFTYTELTSTRLSSLGSPLKSELALDVWIPASPNPSWAGTIAASISIPSLNVNSQWLGQVDVLPLEKSTWQRIKFAIPSDLVSKLQGNYSDLQIKLALNRPDQSGAWLMDRVYFGQRAMSTPKPLFSEGYVIPLPAGSTLDTVAVGQALVRLPAFDSTGGEISIARGAIVRRANGDFADVVAPRGTDEANIDIAPLAEVGNTSAFGDITNRGIIHGTARAGNDITGTGSVTGTQSTNVDLLSREVGRIAVDFPDSATALDITVDPTHPDPSPAPGTYDFVTATTSGTITLHSGAPYYINNLTIGKDTELRLDNGAGPVIVYIRDSFLVRGSVSLVDRSKWNALFVDVGKGGVAIEPFGHFEGSVVAPRTSELMVDPEDDPGVYVAGSFFGRSVTIENVLEHHPFARNDCASNSCGVLGCDTADRDGDGLYDCQETQDGDSFTDPDRFNGTRAHGFRANPSSVSPGSFDTQTKVNAIEVQRFEDHNLYSGWDLEGEAFADVGCRQEVDFWPPWAVCHEDGFPGFDYTGFVHLPSAGKHCFQISTASDNLQGTLFFNGAEHGTTMLDGAQCFDSGPGVYPIRWAFEPFTQASTGELADDRFKVAYCFGGDTACAPSAVIPQAMLQPAYAPSQACSSDSDCLGAQYCAQSGSCRDDGAACTTNVECAPGLACTGGGCVEHCSNGVTDGDEWGVDCGPSCPNKNCRAPISSCTTNTDCGAGTVCSADAASALGLPSSTQKICWNGICESGSGQCGSSDSACGSCLCHPSCENKQCGDDLFDGCNGVCAPVCATHQAGCKSDAECPLDNVCLQASGARFGLAADANVCVPSRCLQAGTAAADCGHPEDACGTVCNPPNYVACQGMACGKDPQTGALCGSCAAGTVCSIDNSCVTPGNPVRVLSGEISFDVGATPGTYAVNATGKSTYRIPLRLPPAARGLTPDLELVFGDSSHVRGILGPGWSLGGASRIHRCVAPSLQSGIGSLDIEAQEPLSNELCLDGRHMRIDDFDTAEARDSDLTIFKLDDDDHSKIVRVDNNVGDLSFNVFKPDGTVYVYGSTAADRRAVLPFDSVTSALSIEELTPTDSWHLAEIHDRFGNVATFHYSSKHVGTGGITPESSITLTNIDYSGRLGGDLAKSYQRRITFHYHSKDDALGTSGGYFHFTPVDDNQLLESITVDTFDGAESHEADRVYNISYTPMPGNGIQRVDSIQECKGAGLIPECLPATTFKYDDAAEADGSTPRFDTPQTGAIDADHALNYIADGGSKLNQTLTLDVDGDGLKDLLHVNLDGTESLRFWHAEGHSDGTVTFAAPVDIVGPKPSCVSGASIADLDGDGRDEIIDSCPVTRQKQQVDYFNIDANGVVTERTGPKSIDSAYIGDIDGNGRPDIIQETDSHVYFTDFHGYAADGSLQFGIPGRVDVKGVASPKGPGGLTRQPLMVDVDGDGTHNLMRFDPSTKQFYALRLANDHELTSAEKSEISLDSTSEPGGLIIFHTQIARWLPTGLSYQVSPLTGAPGHFDSLRVMDINGDGLEDVWVQSATLLAPLDPNLGKIPDVTTGTEPNYSSEIVRINQLIGQLGGSIVVAGPTHLWINVGGAFKLKGAMIKTLDGHEPTTQECDVRTPDGSCVSRIPNEYFRDATVMDYDNDGRDELIVPLGEWHRLSLVSETDQRVYLSADKVPDLPNGPDLYSKNVDSNPNTLLYDLPIFADFNGDSNVDMLVAGYDNTPANRLLVMGTHQGSGRRLTKVTDGLGNTIDIQHSTDRANVTTSGGCGDPFVGLYLTYQPRCLTTVPTVVSEVTRGTVDGADFGQTKYTYEHPATSDFLGGFYFTARTIDENSDVLDGVRQKVSGLREEFGQAIDNGYFTHKFTYPFLQTPTHRALTLSAEPDLDRVARGRTVTEDYVYAHFSNEGISYLAESTRIISDDTTGGPTQVVKRHDVYTTDTSGMPQVHDQKTFAGPGNVEIDHTNVETDRNINLEQWFFGDILTLKEMSERNGVSKTRTTTFDYDDTTDFRKTKTENEGDAERQLVTEYTPDAFGNVAQVTETSADGQRITKTDYGTRGIFPQTTTDAENHVHQLEFDDIWGRLTLMEDANHYQTVQQYDAFGRLVQSESHNGAEITLLAKNTYSAVEPYSDGQLQIPAVLRKTTTSDLFSGEMSEDYDARGFPVRSKSPSIATQGKTPTLVTESAYDWDGRRVLLSDAHTETETPVFSSFEYDLRGRAITSTSPLGDKHFKYASFAQLGGRFPEWTFPDSIELTHITDESGKQAVAIGDHNGALVASANGVDLDGGNAGFVSRTERGAMGLPTKLIDPELHETSTEYDENGLVSSSEDASRGKTQFFYDAYRNVKRIIAADNVESKFEYDGIDRVKTRTDNGQDLTQWSYDVDALNGSKPERLTEMVGPTGIRTVFGYEDTPRALGTSVERIVGDETFTTTTDFDNLGHPTRIDYPKVHKTGGDFEFAVRPVFDLHSGQLVAVQSDDKSTDYWRITDADTRGRVSEVTLGNGVHESYGFDPTSQLLSSLDIADQANTALGSVGYSYYPNGQILERDLTGGGNTRTRSMEYDDARRLHTVTETGPGALDETFGFSPSGRLQSRTKFGDYTPDTDRPLAVGTVAGNEFLYDERGNQKTRSGPNIPGGIQTLTYNRFNLPSQVLFGDPENPDRTVNYEYDAAGTRIVKREANGGPEVLSLGDEYERTKPGGGSSVVQHKFRIFAGSGEVAQLIYNEDTGIPELHYLHRDLQRSVLFTTDGTGHASDIRDFDVFGEPVTTPSWADTTNEAFTGHRNDADTGLVDTGARLYDAAFGVFAAADPLRISGAGSQGFNPYAYANNDPVNLFDPTGLEAVGGPGEPPTTINPDGTTVIWVFGEPRVPPPSDPPIGEFVGNGGNRDDGSLSREELDRIPSGYAAGPVLTPLTRPEFKVRDTSEFWRKSMQVVMASYNILTAAEGIVGYFGTRAFLSKGSEILAGAGGRWATIGEQTGGAIGQATATSCGAACGEMLSGISQAEVMATAGTPTSVAALAKALGAGWRGGYVGPGQLSKLFGLGRPFAAELYEGGKLGHFVVVDGMEAGQVLIRDPAGGGSTYSMLASEFERVWTGSAVFR